MALLLHSSSPSTFSGIKKTHLLFHGTSPPHLLHLPIRSQASEDTDTTTSSSTENPSSSSGLGFGAAADTPAVTKKKGKKEKASVIRRSPVQKPIFTSENEAAQAKEQGQNESAFLLAWLGLGAIILVEGLTLAASDHLNFRMLNYPSPMLNSPPNPPDSTASPTSKLPKDFNASSMTPSKGQMN